MKSPWRVLWTIHLGLLLAGCKGPQTCESAAIALRLSLTASDAELGASIRSVRIELEALGERRARTYELPGGLKGAESLGVELASWLPFGGTVTIEGRGFANPTGSGAAHAEGKVAATLARNACNEASLVLGAGPTVDAGTDAGETFDAQAVDSTRDAAETLDAQAGDAGEGDDAQRPVGPVISDIRAFDVTQTTAKITWMLSEPATGQVDYGTTSSYGQVSVLEPSFQYSSHQQYLSRLIADTVYHYRVRSTNEAGGQSVSGDFTFTTPRIGPVISSVAAFEITQTSAKISWQLSEPGTGQVEYGTTGAYGLTSNLEASYNYSAHTQALSGLSPDVYYHFRIHSKNRAGLESISENFFFKTLP